MSGDFYDIYLDGLASTSGTKRTVFEALTYEPGKPKPKLSPELPLWRYLSIAKFVSLLSTSSLWLGRLDKFGDPFEGSNLPRYVERRRKTFPGPLDEKGYELIYAAMRRWMIASCWHVGKHESDAMWKLYVSNGEGVAIRTTAGKLKSALGATLDAFDDQSPPNKISLPVAFIGPVIYPDPDTHDWYEHEGSQVFGRYFMKRPAFAHEQEFRVVAPLSDIFEKGKVRTDTEPKIGGAYVSIDTSYLIAEVVVAPGAPNWIPIAVRAICSKFSLSCPVRTSTMDEPPLF